MHEAKIRLCLIVDQLYFGDVIVLKNEERDYNRWNKILKFLLVKRKYNFEAVFRMNSKQFREFGYAAVDFVADYLDTVHERCSKRIFYLNLYVFLVNIV